MIYYVNAMTERVVQQGYSLAIEADDEQEALDTAYEVMSEYPDSDLIIQRLLKTDEEMGPIVRVDVELAKEEEEIAEH